ncbi:MAG: hypothetical protein N838_16605 [Thiohalocapsa sp. PB-PSB1]|nr:MAG: hypothetical protein N838_16605 [Thiohalocapsa sp. PB-PSB1]
MTDVPEDTLGDAYEYLIGRFADDGSHTAQEFYTNRTVVHVMTQMLEPQAGERIYDEIARERAYSFLRPEHQQRIADTYHAFADQPGFCRVASPTSPQPRSASPSRASAGTSWRARRWAASRSRSFRRSAITRTGLSAVPRSPEPIQQGSSKSNYETCESREKRTHPPASPLFSRISRLS